MASFYGNMKNTSRSSFIFDRIYSSRVEMEEALYNQIDSNGAIVGDGVFINRYILINYGYSPEGAYKVTKDEVTKDNYQDYYRYDDQRKEYYLGNYNYNTQTYNLGFNNTIKTWYEKSNYVDRFDYNLRENAYYAENRIKDMENYYASFDKTVWQKIYSDNQEKYIMVAELSPEAPTYELITDAPGAMDGAPHFDLSLSTELNYVYHVPKNWNMVLNTYNPEEEYTDDEGNPVGRHYWYYEGDLLNTDKTFDFREEYPFINKKGFSKTTRVIKPVTEEGFELVETKSGAAYPLHQYRPIDLTADTYAPNRYFTLDASKLSQVDQGTKKEPKEYIFDVNKLYYVADNTANMNKLFQYCQLELIEGKYQPLILLGDNDAYWVSDSDPFVLCKDEFELPQDITIGESKYFELTTVPLGTGDRQLVPDKDTKRLDIYLPSIGNAIATMYDAIYGKPRYQSRKIIGYTNKVGFKEYMQEDFGGYEVEGSQYQLTGDQVNDLMIPVYFKDTGVLKGYISYKIYKQKYELNQNGQYMILGQLCDLKPTFAGDDNSDDFQENDIENADQTWNIPVYELIDNIIGYTTKETVPTYTQNEDGQYSVLGDYYNLTDDEIADLSPEMIPGSFDVPVYGRTNMNARPYDDDKLFGKFAPPYDNLLDSDNVSMGWALDALKKYISELRYLANGQSGDLNNGIGLQTDWTLDDDQSFGYIYHKPDIITNFVLSGDEAFISDKTYYVKSMVSDTESVDFGLEKFNELNKDTIDTSEDSPVSLGVYEIPKTMTKNSEVEFYREEEIAGYVSLAEIGTFTPAYSYNDKYFKEEPDHTKSVTYYSKNENTFIEVTGTLSNSATYYIEITDTVQVFTINNAYYYIENSVINNLQKYSNSTKNNEVTKVVTAFIPTEQYFINSGSRYTPAYRTVGTYSFQPVTSDQYNEDCLCYFDKFQQITVVNNEITERRYRFNSYGDTENNIWLTTGHFHEGGVNDIDNHKEFNDKRVKQFNVVIDYENNSDSELKEFYISEDLSITELEDLNRQQLINYLTNNDVFSISKEDGTVVTLPKASFEILDVYDEEYSLYRNRNNNALDFNQYVASIKQYDLDKDYWESSRNSTTYYLRDFRPIEQIDYEINTIWNSIKVDD